MNALQIIPPKPAAKVSKSALLFRVVVTTLLLALGRIGMSRGEDGTAAAPDAVTQPAAASAAAITEGSDSGGDGSEEKEKGAAPAQPIVQSAKSATEPLANSAAPVAPKSDLAPKSEDANVRKTASGAMTARSAGPVRHIHQPRGHADHRSWKAAETAPAWVGPPPVIYGIDPNATAPYAAGPVVGTQDRMSMASVRGAWERVVDAPGAVLNGGKQALYGVLDSIW